MFVPVFGPRRSWNFDEQKRKHVKLHHVEFFYPTRFVFAWAILVLSFLPLAGATLEFWEQQQGHDNIC